MHKLASTQGLCSLRTGSYIGDLNVWHPLEWNVSILFTCWPEADDRCALVVRQVLVPERTVACGKHTRVEVHYAFVFGNSNVGTDNSANLRYKGMTHADFRIDVFGFTRLAVGTM